MERRWRDRKREREEGETKIRWEERTNKTGENNLTREIYKVGSDQNLGGNL